jgi:hypothetical protein
MNEQIISRFWSKVEKVQSGCWLWKASKRNKGYGAFTWHGNSGELVQGLAHRFSYELHFKEIPKGICVLHRCDVPSCVNPEHLFLGTKQENNDDMCKKGRHKPGASKTPLLLCRYKRGTAHHAYKFSDETIFDIRAHRKEGLSYGKISKKFCMCIAYVWRICNREVRRGTDAIA